jgi:predicted ATPase
MITKWKLFNFKSVKNETDIEFGPLTIFAGANSSGKSTLIQSILLVSQTLSHRTDSRSIVLNGALARLGQFDDLKSQNSEAGQIVVGVECSIPANRSGTRRAASLGDIWETVSQALGTQQIDSLGCELSFDADPSSPERDIYQLRPRLFGCQVTTSSSSPDGEATKTRTASISVSRASGLADSRAKLDGLTEEERSGALADAALGFDVSLDRDSSAELEKLFSARAIGCLFRHFLPSQLVVRARAKDSNLLGLLREQFAEDAENEPGEAEAGFSGAAEIAKDRDSITSAQLPSLLRTAATHLENIFTKSLKYLGPLRDEPKALYPLAAGVDPTDVGLKGEYTAAVLDLHRGRQVRYIPTAAFRSAEIEVTTSLRTLEVTVTDWLRYFDVAQSVLTVDKGKLGHELKVIPPGLSEPHDLTHVGVGISQILPILVMCLLAEPDTTLIFEQPELHLHPKVQTLLGDFFLSMGLLGKQCILETHSEYLINRLRFRAAASQSDDTAKKIRMYFVEKHGDTSNFRPVVVNEFGAILDWPEGFFDQSQDEAEQIVRAATQKRQAREGRLPRAGGHN